ncbi:MAG: hypothetical protein JST22_06645 [Bacteroidetes bacterium]|nr:hypothetical protein [Bacteroidota bacterium]
MAGGRHAASRFDRPVLRTVALCTVAALLCSASVSTALPRFALLTGTRCSACHYNPQGSSIRTDLGYSTMNEVGAFNVDSLGLPWLRANESNTYWNGLVSFGLETRFEVAKLGRPPNDVRMVIPMQLTPTIAINPLDGLTLYGAYNAGPLRYPGQTAFDAVVQYQPSMEAPMLRAGYIQPSIGLRYDDHTIFIRRDVASSAAPIIAPNYNEVGAELTYEGQQWLTVNLGAFSARNLSQADPTVDSKQLSYLARVMLWPRLLEEGVNGEVGASIYGNGRFRMLNVFAGAGLNDRASLQGEMMVTSNADNRTIRNYSVMGSYQLYPWLTLNGRYEHGTTENPARPIATAQGFVVGAEFFPIPLVELRPEYRYVITDAYILGQYTLQLHVFY